MAGDHLQTGGWFVRRLIAERRIHCIEIHCIELGRYVRVPRSVLDPFIESGRVRAAPGTR